MATNFVIPPPPVGNDVASPSFRDWFFKIGALILAVLDLSNATGVLSIEHGGTGSELGVKVYEPVIGDPTSFVFSSDGDILVAWGGGYVS